jgi:hypothetical protein
LCRDLMVFTYIGLESVAHNELVAWSAHDVLQLLVQLPMHSIPFSLFSPDFDGIHHHHKCYWNHKISVIPKLIQNSGNRKIFATSFGEWLPLKQEIMWKETTDPEQHVEMWRELLCLCKHYTAKQ